ncbi:MAG: beta-eliminating lyase-related protein [Bacteroidales bacterium]
MRHSFGSDNHSGAAKEIIDAISAANQGFSIAYGEDSLTAKAQEIFKRDLGNDTYVYFVFNGTGANILALKAMTESFNSILCPDTAHIYVDECGAPEKLTGCKVIPIPNVDGKVNCDNVRKELKGFGFQHHSQPKVLSISQPTELGTLYTKKEILELANLMHSHNGYLHMDGSRISNASASMNIPIKEFTVDCGVDALSFGGTKNGLLIGEAVVFFKKELAQNFLYIRKQAAQLFSKNRFIAAQFIAFLENGLNIKLATHSNNMAKYLEQQLKEVKEVQISRPVQTNAVFALIDPNLCEKLQQKHYFYVWDEETNEVRWMCSFNTHKKEIDLFVKDLKALAENL